MSGSTTYALGQTGYDSLGRVRCVAQRMNPAEFASPPSDTCALDTQGSYGPDRITRNSYDAAGQLLQVQGAYGVTTANGFPETLQQNEATYTYSPNGLVQTLTDGNGNASYFHYDGHDRLQYWVMPSATATGSWDWSNIEYYGYDAAGNRTLLVRRDGNSTTFSYDNLNRVTAKDLPGSEPTVSYAYDLLGRMTSAATSAQTLTFAFDTLGRNTSQSGPHGTVGYGYDLAGRRTQMTYADSGLVVGYTYNVAGDMTEIRENPSGGNVLLGSYAYDDLGRRTSLTRGNGAVTSYTYDNASRLTQLVQNLNGTSSDLTLDFTPNPVSEIASNTRSNDAFSFTQANANVASSVNGLNQVTVQGGASVSHDARGNVSAIGSASYGYDSENRLTSAPASVTFGYDPLGRLYYSTGNPQLTRFAYDGGALIAEYDYGMGLLRRYVNGPGVDEPLVWYEGTGTSTRRYFHADERGSVVAVSDGSGNLVGSTPNRYDEYGTPQGTLTGRFGYTGQMWLPEVGLYHYRARAYNPAMGRFMQTDPIGYGGGMNLYAYVGNNPVNATDPSGLAAGGTDLICTGTRLCNQGQNGVFGLGTTGYMFGGEYDFERRFITEYYGPNKTFLGKGVSPWLPYIGSFVSLLSGGASPSVGEPRTKRLSQCMQRFLASRGFNSPNLGSIRFVEGMQATPITRTAEARGFGAITRGNTVYVRPSRWAEISSPSGGSLYFEEIIHSIQSHVSGSRSFDLMNVLGGIMGGISSGDMHNNHIEAQAIGLSRGLSVAYRSLPASQRCSD